MKKTIAIVTSGLEFNGNTVYETAIGGSESAVIYIARELAKTNDVVVYCHCDKPGYYDNVDYRDIGWFNHDDKAQVDVLIVSRFTGYLSGKFDAKMTILWCHDISIENPELAFGCADRVFCLSDWHKKLYCKQYNITPYSYVWKTSNGYDQTIVNVRRTYEERKNNFIYASRPERGLKLLLETIWPRIVEKNPEAILHLCGYENNLAVDVEELQGEIDILLSESVNIKRHGTLNKKEYYSLLSECAFMLYPTNFPEISCINAIEAQYNGCNVITTHDFALSETVKTPTKIRSVYGSDDYVEKFLKLLDVYHCDIDMSSYSWEAVAKSWDVEIDKMFMKRYESNKDKIIDMLVYNSDIVAAYELTGDIKYRAMLDKAHDDNLTKSDFKKFYKDEDYHLGDRGLQLLELVESEIEKRGKLTILDLGSNDGVLSLPIMKRYSDSIEKMVLYDSSKDVLEFVEECYGTKYPQIEYIVDDVRNVLSYDIKPDIVILGEILEHIEDTVEFLNFLMKLSDGSTLFYFTVPRGPWESISNCTDIHHVHHFELNDIHHIFANVDVMVSKNNGTVLGRRGEPCDNWMFWFVGDVNSVFNKMDYQDKWIKTRPYKTVSCCLIVKNEEDHLMRCLKSVKDISDEIIIVDTGSTDDSLYIAGKFTDKIYHLDWEESDGLGNFSRARNYGIDKAVGDYIFYIDADEELADGRQIFKLAYSDYYDAVLLMQMQVCTRDRLTVYGDVRDELHPRLFKNDGIRFSGVIHEFPTRNGEDYLSKGVWQRNATIIHYGYANISLYYDPKYHRNQALIRKNIREFPDRLIAKYYYLTDIIDGISNTGDISQVDVAYDYWSKELKFCKDSHVADLAQKAMQILFRRCYNSEQIVMGKELQVCDYEKEGKKDCFCYIDSHDYDYFYKKIVG